MIAPFQTDRVKVEVLCSKCRVPVLRRRRNRFFVCRQCRGHAGPSGAGGFAGHLFDDRFRVARRERKHPCRYPFVRKVQGSKYQLRLYVGGGKGQGVSINLGLFDSEWLAGEAFKKVARLLRGPSDPLSVWQQVKPLMLAGVLPPTLLPKYVFRRPDGYGARRHLGDPGIGPFDSPEAAYRAITGAAG